jgi:hypothetical protein
LTNKGDALKYQAIYKGASGSITYPVVYSDAHKEWMISTTDGLQDVVRYLGNLEFNGYVLAEQNLRQPDFYMAIDEMNAALPAVLENSRPAKPDPTETVAEISQPRTYLEAKARQRDAEIAAFRNLPETRKQQTLEPLNHQTSWNAMADKVNCRARQTLQENLRLRSQRQVVFDEEN